MIKKRRFHVLLVLLFFSSTLYAQRAFVNNIIHSVNIDSLMLTVRQLSGDTTVIINNNIDTIKNRYADSTDIKKAANFIKQKLNSFGLTAIEQPFISNGYNGKNIYAIQHASSASYLSQKLYYVICAHYDNLPKASINYGADDNASGVSAVIEAARILSRYALPFNIYYVLFDFEEQGKIGSDFFCNTLDIGTIKAAINLDMIAYDGNNDSVANIHSRNIVGDDVISNKLLSVNTTYPIGLNLTIINPPSYQSDHASFWNYFMPAILFIEDDKHDFNPGYHSINDKINLFNKSYYHSMAKLAIGALADFASDSLTVGINDIMLKQNEIFLYPNPVKNQIHFSHIHSNKVCIKITNTNGEIIFDMELIPQQETITIDLPESIANGLYHVSLMSDGEMINRKFITQ